MQSILSLPEDFRKLSIQEEKGPIKWVYSLLNKEILSLVIKVYKQYKAIFSTLYSKIFPDKVARICT